MLLELLTLPATFVLARIENVIRSDRVLFLVSRDNHCLPPSPKLTRYQFVNCYCSNRVFRTISFRFFSFFPLLTFSILTFSSSFDTRVDESLASDTFELFMSIV